MPDQQLEGTFRELGRYGLAVERIIVNNVVETEESPFLRTKSREQRRYLKHIHGKYSGLEIIEIPMFPQEVKGPQRLEEVKKILVQGGM